MRASRSKRWRRTTTSRRPRSRRPPFTNARREPEIVFFTDRDLGRIFPDALAAAGIKVERHSDHFAHDTPDESWIPIVAARGWIAMSHDKRISRRPNEKAAVLEAGLGLILIVGHATHAELAGNLVNTFPAVERFVRRQQRPFIARLYRPAPAELKKKLNAKGRIELVAP